MASALPLARMYVSLMLLVAAMALYLPRTDSILESKANSASVSESEIAATRAEAMMQAELQGRETYSYIAPGMPAIGMQGTAK
jgi:hypothetical protein